MPETDLLKAFHGYLSSAMDDNGFEISPGLGIDAEGGLSMYALALPPTDAYRMMISTWRSKKHHALIFALDRYALPDQGTVLNDLLAGWYFTADDARPFIVQYQVEPREIMPIDWSNGHWNAALGRELVSAAGRDMRDLQW
jgi:hypothetical protein